MLTDGVQVAVPANSTVNAFAGRPIEFIGVQSVERVLLIADAIGVQAQLLINVGAEQKVPLAAGTPVNFSGVIGAGPKDDEDTMCPQIAVPAGARQQLNFTNTTGAPINVRYRAIIA
jgi:hypothetical protein